MFLDGMGDQLSWQQYDDRRYYDHTEGDPLDGVECGVEIAGGVGVRLADEGEKELNGACGGEGDCCGVVELAAAFELAKEDEGEERGGDGGVESDGVEAGVVGRDAEAPREGGGETGVAAFGEVAEGEEGPDEGGAGTPCVERVSEWKLAEAEIDQRCEEGEEDSRGRERRYGEEKDGVGEEVVEVGCDEKEAGEDEGGEEGEEACVPEFVGVESDNGGCPQAEGEGGHEAKGGEYAEGRKKKMAGVDEVGVHVRGLKSKYRDPSLHSG
jgi:hypothetical protein